MNNFITYKNLNKLIGYNNYFKEATRHHLHILKSSIYPFLGAFFVSSILMAIIFFFNSSLLITFVFLNKTQIFLSILGLIYSTILWIVAIIKETGEGNHPARVQKGLQSGFYLFLITEIMLFFSFFWSYFWYSLNTSFLIGGVWPPLKTQEISAYTLPLFNTSVLLLSGYTITLTHKKILNYCFDNDIKTKNLTNKHLLLTIILGLIFLISQKIEYLYGLKNVWSTNVFWSCFFLLTGFHGIHVLVGTLMLIFNYLRILLFKNYSSNKYLNENLLFLIWYYKTNLFYIIKIFIVKNFYFKKNFLNFNSFNVASFQHLSFEIALFYWHFVDIVWIFLYLTVYFWGF